MIVMLTLVKAEGYRMLHRFDFFAVAMVAAIVTVLGSLVVCMTDISFDGWKANFMGDILQSGGVLIVIYSGFVSLYMMSDYFKYKLFNSEIVNGNRMCRIYGVHTVLVAAVASAVFCFVVILACIIYTLETGEQACNQMAEKMLLLFCIVFRMACVAVLHIYLLRNVFIAMLLYIINQVTIVGMFFSVIEGVFDRKVAVFTSVDQLHIIFDTTTNGQCLTWIIFGTVIEIAIMGILFYLCYLWKGKRVYE